MSRLLEICAAVGLLVALIWAVLAGLYVAAFGPTPDDLSHQPELSLVFPGARLEPGSQIRIGQTVLELRR